MKQRKKDPRGRKPKNDKKRAVTVYIEESIIKSNGGLEQLKEKILVAIELGEL